MTSIQDMAREFHDAFGCHVADAPTVPPPHIRRERALLLVEECAELVTEITAGMDDRYEIFDEMVALFADRACPIDRPPEIPKVARELADSGVVLGGAAVNWGIPLDDAVAEVHRANMSKAGPDGRPIVDANGKVRKGPNFEPPDLWSVVAAAAGKGTA